MQTLSPCLSDWQSAPCGLRVRSLRTNDEQEAGFLWARSRLSVSFLCVPCMPQDDLSEGSVKGEWRVWPTPHWLSVPLCKGIPKDLSEGWGVFECKRECKPNKICAMPMEIFLSAYGKNIPSLGTWGLLTVKYRFTYCKVRVYLLQSRRLKSILHIYFTSAIRPHTSDIF